MFAYIIRRLLLLPLTLFVIVLVNFVIINLAPGDPISSSEISEDGAATRDEEQNLAFGSDYAYLQFREHYGLTLPVLFNTWPWVSEYRSKRDLQRLSLRRWHPDDSEEMSVKDYEKLRIHLGDQARFTMANLLNIARSPKSEPLLQQYAVRFFIRGGTRQAIVGPNPSPEERSYNRFIEKNNLALRELQLNSSDDVEIRKDKLAKLYDWYKLNNAVYHFEPPIWRKPLILLFETRLCRYLSRVFTLDFGTMRNDDNKRVIDQVMKRFKYSLTLAVIPMLITFVLCQIFGFYMAVRQSKWQDFSLNVIFLILYATPVFVVAPFLIEKVALNNTFPFTDIAIPFSGFSSPESQYELMGSSERLFDVLRHIALPLVAVMYGGLAAQSRLSRTAVLEVLRQDYVRTAKAKGLSNFTILSKHVGRNAAITIVTSIAGSLGVVLGGSLIIETIFEINGFGRFFYDAVINRDYNVIMFSTLSGSLFTLVGYFLADITYTLLDPRVTLD